MYVSRFNRKHFWHAVEAKNINSVYPIILDNFLDHVRLLARAGAIKPAHNAV